jgi:hypothetical protein
MLPSISLLFQPFIIRNQPLDFVGCLLEMMRVYSRRVIAENLAKLLAFLVRSESYPIAA